jgi:hypothetical protein
LHPLSKLRLLTLAAIIAAGCGSGSPRTPRATAVRVAVDGQPAFEVQVRVSSNGAARTERWLDAVRQTAAEHVKALGVVPSRSLTVVDDAPIWSSGRGMAVEAAVARTVAVQYWRDSFPCAADDWFVGGLSRYTATNAVVAARDVPRAEQSVGLVESRYFGGLMPWLLPLPVPAATAGNGLAMYRENARADPGRAVSVDDRAALEAKTALAMATMANWMGKPAWDVVIRQFVASYRGRCPTPDDLNAVANATTGLTLDWFFRSVFHTTDVFDYAVERLATTRVNGAGYRTTVVVRRLGEASFTGRGAAPPGPFDSGSGIDIATAFADGSLRVDAWDGVARTREFTYDSVSPALWAAVDASHVLVLDVHPTNNSVAVAPRTVAAADRWAARWTLWLQDLLMSYAFQTSEA